MKNKIDVEKELEEWKTVCALLATCLSENIDEIFVLQALKKYTELLLNDKNVSKNN